MANYKAEIAEALFDSSVKVSKDALLWAMTNLPDGENKGTYKAAKLAADGFNHESENMWEALGLSKERVSELASIMSKELAKSKDPDSKVSIIVQNVINAIDENPDLLKIVVTKTVHEALDAVDAMSSMGDMAKMLKIMKMIDKLKGGGHED